MNIPFSQIAYENPSRRLLVSQGVQAHADGLKLADNPYKRGSFYYRLWAVGWACGGLFEDEARKLN